ncbi:hypothetical protein PAHAL_5G158100 [Panicum hallii]|uniref:Uncharacterized protein n=1 Tax=Panicum hallii TaxID=206008 RepID=A0A2T8IK34_9POAL|nr:hypothetical protein PAHAL_5G158100 [Panicum hallii]
MEPANHPPLRGCDPRSARLPGYAYAPARAAERRPNHPSSSLRDPAKPRGEEPPPARRSAHAPRHRPLSLCLPHGASVLTQPFASILSIHPPTRRRRPNSTHRLPASATSPHASGHGLPLYHHASNLRHA